ncbi:MFS transporter [Microbulbifer epialgicus]|uniref:MFS transporter n=1 Tax=Microbulbifer epialgicus TaxID=393907 RepID=A0ABV4NXE0_9GAMM
MKTITPNLTDAKLLGLVALGFAVFFVTNDLGILTVAIPTIGKEFNGNITTVQWLINGYTLVFGVLLISGGRLADIFGRRRAFFVGSAIFVFFSILCGLAIDIQMLLVSRALMGIGGALIWPAILGMIYNLIPREHSGLAGGFIMAVSGVGLTIGPLIGGVITDLASWRLTFFLNPIEAAIACLLGWKFVADDRPQGENRGINYAGVLTLSISIFSLLLALDLSVDIGFRHPLIVALMTLSFLFIGIFIIVEHKASDNALIPRDIAQNYRLFTASLATLMISVVFFAPIFYIPQALNKIHGYSATLSGIGLLPMLIAFSIGSYLSGILYERLSPKVIVSLGVALICAGMFMLSDFNKDTDIFSLTPGLTLLGAGIGIFYSTITTIAITIVDPSRSSLSAGILYMFQVAGGTLGLGINTTIIAMSPDLLSGIVRAFTVNAYLAIAVFVVCLLFVSGEPSGLKNRHNRQF